MGNSGHGDRFSLRSARIIRGLEQIMEWRGRPAAIRCDNGPENTSGQIQAWADRSGIQLQYIQPGKPQQNAYVERFSRTVRYEWLSQYYWDDLDEVRLFATRWMDHYNHRRLPMALEASHQNSGWSWPRNFTSSHP